MWGRSMTRGRGLLTALLLALAGCAAAPQDSALPRGGYYKVGKPYQIKGVWYYPKEDYAYDETGIASWYGPGFHQERTANGETFDQNDVSAAHKTLPMPSLVRVTNLENGRQLVVRVNDRGPFVAGRIIDLSRRSAQLLGVVDRGTAKVRVAILADESKALASAAKNGQSTTVASAAGTSDSSGSGGFFGGVFGGSAKPRPVAEMEPVPQAAPRMAVEVEGAPQPARAKAPERPPVTESVASVPGETKGGRFMPAPEIKQVRVTGGQNIFVQVGAFSRSENAQGLHNRLSGIHQANVVPATVNGERFYRVRLGPLQSVEQADEVLNRVVASGIKEAPRIVVD